VRQFASDVLDAQGINWDFQTPPELEQIKLDPEQRRHLFLIFKEALNNIARHADCQYVWLSVVSSNSCEYLSSNFVRMVGTTSREGGANHAPFIDNS
jgi:signal transduction histidine kinase